jgi:hypothetical protein
MSERSREKATRLVRKFMPGVRQLEGRLLPGAGAVPQLSTRGGDAIQTGTLLGVTVDPFGPNTVRVMYNGTGYVQVKWNGGHFHSFSGVGTVDIHAQDVRKETMTFALTGQASAALAVADGSSGHAATAFVHARRSPRARVLSQTASGNHGGAVQSGSVLTVNVASAKGNSVQLSDAGFGNVQVAWNGGPAHSFAGITKIVVHATRARNDQVIFTGPIG